jgi:transposase
MAPLWVLLSRTEAGPDRACRADDRTAARAEASAQLALDVVLAAVRRGGTWSDMATQFRLAQAVIALRQPLATIAAAS